MEKESGCVGAQIDFLKQRRIYVDPRCRHTIWELSAWRWKKDGMTGEYEDVPQDMDDHAMAALRYGIEGERKKRRIVGLPL